MEAVIFIGIPGSGKSTFYKERFADTHLRLNLDMLRTRHRERILLEACLAARQPFVVDNTNPSPEDRARYIAPARAAGFRVVAYLFRSDLEECLARNEARAGKGRVPLPALRAALRRLVPPAPEEGFDEIRRVEIAPGGAFHVLDTP